VPILHGWFWSSTKTSRTAAELIDIYYQAVGRNGNWLLNLSPDKRRVDTGRTACPVALMAQVVDEPSPGTSQAGGKLTSDNSTSRTIRSLALDGNLNTWWEAAPGQTTATLTLTLPGAVTFDVVSLRSCGSPRPAH